MVSVILKDNGECSFVIELGKEYDKDEHDMEILEEVE